MRALTGTLVLKILFALCIFQSAGFVRAQNAQVKQSQHLQTSLSVAQMQAPTSLFCKMVSWVENISSQTFEIKTGENTLRLGSYTAYVKLHPDFRSVRIAKTKNENPYTSLKSYSDHYENFNFSVDSDYASIACSNDKTQLNTMVFSLSLKSTFAKTKPVSDKLIHVATHPSTAFGQEITQAAHENLMRALTDRKIPSIMLSHLKAPDTSYFISPKQVSRVVFSEGGAHSIKLIDPGSKVILSGGYIDQCMCESLRDFVRDAQAGHRLTVVIPTDATTSSQTSDFSEIESESPQTLETLFLKATHQEIMAFVMSKIWGATEDGPMPSGFLCPFQNSVRSGSAVAARDYSLEVVVIRDTAHGMQAESLAPRGTGSKVVRLIFTPSKHLGHAL